MEEKKISFEEFKFRVAGTLKMTSSEIVKKHLKDVLYLANRIDFKLDEKETRNKAVKGECSCCSNALNAEHKKLVCKETCEFVEPDGYCKKFKIGAPFGEKR